MTLSVSSRFEGLSPRRRGNPGPYPRYPPRSGPIPAQAGEPMAMMSLNGQFGAYPRAGGGTLNALAEVARWPGLSPRRRGNLLPHGLHPGAQGPIPAQAGEPSRRGLPRWPLRAYPRAGGGTLDQGQPGDRLQVHGYLSDLVRPGPIPAQAGEPASLMLLVPLIGAYPRAGGGTGVAGVMGFRNMGLSPRRRGNRAVVPCDTSPAGPIPAQAGEPAQAPHKAPI